MRKSKHRVDPYKEKVIEMLAEGNTYNAICDYLSTQGIFIGEPELCVYCRNRGIKTLITNGYHNDKVPHCKECPNYLEVGTKYIRDRNTNVKVCRACLEVIPQNTQTSPLFCPLRKGGDK